MKYLKVRLHNPGHTIYDLFVYRNLLNKKRMTYIYMYEIPKITSEITL